MTHCYGTLCMPYVAVHNLRIILHIVPVREEMKEKILDIEPRIEVTLGQNS